MHQQVELFPYQVIGAEFLAAKKRALLADEPGLGKTAQAIRAAHLAGAERILVVCPASVVENWTREFAKFYGSQRELRVVSYDMATRGRVDDYKFDTIFLDEVHYLKSRSAKRTKAVFGEKCDGKGGLVERACRVYMLSATPTPNHAAELWPLLRAVMPGAIAGHNGKPLTYWGFVQKYCYTRDNGFGIQIVKGKNLPELKRQIAPYVLRRKKADVLTDLPPIRFDTLPVAGKLELSADDKQATWAIAKALDERGVDGLRELAPHVASLRRVTGLAKVAGCVEWIKEWFEGGGGKLVVFAHHRDAIEALWRGTATCTGCAVVTGDCSVSKRQAMVDAFQNAHDVNLFIGQIQAAGVGITLTAASDVLFVESSWVPAENEQAAMRIHRISQKNACLVRFAMLAGSIDEQIQRAVVRKTHDIARLFA